MAGVNEKEVEKFWIDVKEEINRTAKKDLKKLPLPATRIKKIMKIDKDVKLISSETPLLLAKASEIFIRELALKSWHETREHKRATLQKSDIAAAMKKDEMYDFLVDIVPGNDKPKTTNLMVFEVGHKTKKIIIDHQIKQVKFTRNEPAPKTNTATVPVASKGNKENGTPEFGRAKRMFQTQFA